MFLLKRPSLLEIRKEALYQAERDLITAQGSLDYYEALVQLLQKRVSRLTDALSTTKLLDVKEPTDGNQILKDLDPSSAKGSSDRHDAVREGPQSAPQFYKKDTSTTTVYKYPKKRR